MMQQATGPRTAGSDTRPIPAGCQLNLKLESIPNDLIGGHQPFEAVAGLYTRKEEHMSSHHPSGKWRLQPAMGVRSLSLVICGLVSALVVSAAGTGPATSASNDRTTASSSTAFAPPGASDAGVITDWNATAVATLLTDAAKSPAEAYVYFAFTHAAMFNAVVGITGKYRHIGGTHTVRAGRRPKPPPPAPRTISCCTTSPRRSRVSIPPTRPPWPVRRTAHRNRPV